MARGEKQTPERGCRSEPLRGSRARGRETTETTNPVEAEVEALEHLEAAEPEPPSASKPRPPGPDNCHQFVRRQLAKALPDLFAALLVIAKKGDVSTVKLLWQLAQLDRPAGTAGGHEEDSKFVRDTLAKYRNR